MSTTKPKTQSQLEWIGSHFESFQRNGHGYKALCPLHGDSNPSLSINEGDDGRILINCHAGCQAHDLLEVVGLRFADLKPGAPRIVAEYDYRDEQGQLVSQTVKYEPKDFRQRQPRKGGGWDWSTKGVPRVLYRLPELLTSDPHRPVFICEGEKDCDRLASLNLTATTNVGGAGNWLSQYNQYLSGRHLVILPDNDAKGWDHARNVAGQLQGIAASIKIVELPGLPEKGDVSDWLDNGGRQPMLLGIVHRTAPTLPTAQRPNGSEPDGRRDGCSPSGRKKELDSQYETRGVDPLGTSEAFDPVPDGPMGKVAPFPVEVFPGVLRQFVESVATALPCPADFVGAMILAVLATFIGRKRLIEIKSSWQEYPVLWIAVVARSGDRKSPAFEIVTEPLRHRQQMFLAEYLKAKADYAALPPDERAETSRPRLKQILTTDTTIEALKDVLWANPNGIIHTADELSGWVRSIGQYKGGRGDDRQNWLSTWSGTQIVSNRKGNDEPIVINDPFVCVTGGIQPDALPDIIDDTREDGFSARVLFSYPDPIPHGEWTETAVAKSLDYHSICEELWKLEPSDEPVTFSADAKAVWIEWVNTHRAETPLDNLRPTWSKAEGHCLRLALVLHLVRKLCNETRSPQIDLPSIEGACKLIEYFKSHTRRVYGQLAMSVGKERIPRALQWVRKHGGRVTARLARMNGFVKSADEAVQLFHDLEELGHGTVTQGKQSNVTFTLRAAKEE